MAIKKRKFKSPTLQWTYDRYIGNDPKQIEEYEQEVLNAEIARKVYDLRTKAAFPSASLPGALAPVPLPSAG